MRISKTAASAAIIAIAIVLPTAKAANMDEVDCAGSSFAFSEAGYHVDCQRATDHVRAGESTGASEVDVMTISADEPRIFLTVVGVRLTATRLYMQYRGLRENFRDTFSHIEIEDWNGIGNRRGYDSAEFNAVISGLPSSCVAIQRYTNAAWSGFKRRVIGMGCSPAGRELVYSTLTKLRAPGD